MTAGFAFTKAFPAKSAIVSSRNEPARTVIKSKYIVSFMAYDLIVDRDYF